MYGHVKGMKEITQLYVKYPELSSRNTDTIANAFNSCDIILVEEYSLIPIMRHDRNNLSRYLEPLLFPTIVFDQSSINILVAGVAPWLFYVVEGIVAETGNHIRVAYGSRSMHSYPARGDGGSQYSALFKKH